MAQTTAKKAAKVPAQRRSTAKKTAPAQKSAIARTTELSEDVLKSVEKGQRAAIDAVRSFLDRIDEALPDVDRFAERRETVIDAALEMADRLVTAQYEFLHGVVRDTGKRLDERRTKQ